MAKSSTWRRILISASLMTLITFVVYLVTQPMMSRLFMPMVFIVALLPFFLGTALGGAILGRIPGLGTVEASDDEGARSGVCPAGDRPTGVEGARTDVSVCVSDDVSGGVSGDIYDVSNEDSGSDRTREPGPRGLRWPAHVHAALVSSVLTMIIVWFFLDQVSPRNIGQYPGVLADQLRSMLTIGLAHVAGVFVLPILDPAVRRTGPMTSGWRLLLIAAFVPAVALLVDVALIKSGANFIGLGALALGAVIALAGVAVALFLTLTGAVLWGAWVGGLGILIAFTSFLTWVVTGMHWFP